MVGGSQSGPASTPWQDDSRSSGGVGGTTAPGAGPGGEKPPNPAKTLGGVMNLRAAPLVPVRPQLLWIEHPPTFDHLPDLARVLDVLQRIRVEQHDVSELADLQRAEVVSGADYPMIAIIETGPPTAPAPRRWDGPLYIQLSTGRSPSARRVQRASM